MEANNRQYLSELVTGFADGELTPDEELLLKSEMNSDSSLMDELKHHLLVKDAVKKDIEAFTPPAEAVKGIFSSLGYTSPYANKPPVKKSWFPLFRRASVLALLLIGSFVGYELLTSDNSDNLATNENNSNTIVNNLNNTESNKVNNTEIPVVNSNEVKNNNIVKSTKSINNNLATKVNNTKIANNEVESSNTQLADNTIQINEEIIVDNNNDVIVENIAYSSYYSNRPSNLPMNSHDNGSANPLTNISNYRFGFISDTEYKLYVKGYNTNNSMFSSMSLGVLFLSKYNFKGGFEVGQQNYSVLVSDDLDINILPENRDVFWYAATVRYDAKDISFYNVTPFAQFAIGSGNFGKYMARYSVGMEYTPFEHGIGINFGYEGSNLWYSTQNNPYSTSANGIVFGLSWKF